MGFSPLDIIALVFFWVVWFGFGWLVERSAWAKLSLTYAVTQHRLRWMMRMCERDQRIFDASLTGNLMHSTSFLASGTILILGGIIALLGSIDRLYEAVQTMPFILPVSKGFLEIKVMVLGLVFVYSFLKFTWSLRQFNYCCIIMGSAPNLTVLSEEKRNFAKQAARVGQLAARSFNQGLRGYYFSLAAVGWFIHPIALIVGTLMVLAILWRREFYSKTRAAMRGM